MSLNRCPRNGTPHDPHPIRLYFSGMGAVVPTTCPGEGADDIDEREPDADAVYDVGHDCREEMVETESHPTRSGRITVTEECGLCGRVLRTYTDSVL
jgi:hypothetical protein